MKAAALLSVADGILQAVRSGSLLATGEQAAPECRTIINRAYYSAFNSVVEYFATLGWMPGKSDNNHIVVQQALSGTSDPKMRDVGHKLQSLSSERKKADYDLNDPRPESRAQAELAVRMARSAIHSLAEATGGPSGPRTADEVDAYLRRKQSPAYIKKQTP